MTLGITITSLSRHHHANVVSQGLLKELGIEHYGAHGLFRTFRERERCIIDGEILVKLVVLD